MKCCHFCSVDVLSCVDEMSFFNVCFDGISENTVVCDNKKCISMCTERRIRNMKVEYNGLSKQSKNTAKRLKSRLND